MKDFHHSIPHKGNKIPKLGEYKPEIEQTYEIIRQLSKAEKEIYIKIVEKEGIKIDRKKITE